MTNRDGDVVQHYGYTAFGHERYQHNTAAFDVTNRYTGQQIDDETGLYFYQSRYYDAELGRFTQADTIVPSADTSQALNRYAYVKNNPLRFTDPTGHSFWDTVKQWIGTIVTLALCIAAPWGSGFWATFSYSVIGSAVGAAVNGGTFKSFAIGVGIGLAAGAIASGLGSGGDFMSGVKGYFSDAGSAFQQWASSGIFEGFAAGAFTGAVAGAISSAVYGGNWGTNIGQGAMGGAIGAGVGMATGAVVGKLKAWIMGMSATKETLDSISVSIVEPSEYDPQTLDLISVLSR